MKPINFRRIIPGLVRLALVLTCSPSKAALRHVWTESPAPAVPYATWETAAHDVQTAIDTAAVDDTVLVRDGLYAPAVEILVDKRLRLASESGPAACILSGGGAHRVVNASATGAFLCGFTVTNGSGVDAGGGVYLGAATISNCVVTGNSLAGVNSYGAGVFCAGTGGRIEACVIARNSAMFQGAGVHLSTGNTLARCRVEENTCDYIGGGVFVYRNGIIENCVIARNDALDGAGIYLYDSGGGLSLSGSTITGNTANYGGGLYVEDAACDAHNVILWGNTAETGPNAHLTGASSLTQNYSCTSPLPAGAGNVEADPLFVDAAAGYYRISALSPCRNTGDPAGGGGQVDLAGNPRIWEGRVDMGAYEHYTPVHYAAPSGSSKPPYATWEHAATNLQDAVDAAEGGDTVLVATGDYGCGGRPAPGLTLTNRVCITNAITLLATNGPGATIIHGAADPGTGGQGAGAVRALWASAAATIAGFTLRDGWTAPIGDSRESGGGGAQLSAGAMLSNCLVRVNHAGPYSGGGVYCGREGRITDCRIFDNGAGLGGGLFAFTDSQVDRCAISNNVATGHAGGVYLLAGAELRDALICANSTTGTGGGLLSYAGNRLRHVTIAGNSAGDDVGGAYLDSGDTLLNSIVCSNSAPVDPDLRLHASAVVSNSCAPGLSGNGNLDAAPSFVNPLARNYRLQPGSPCIDRGDAGAASGERDLDGGPREAGVAPDMGAYESHYVHYASPTGLSIPPYLSWDRAAARLQDAVDAAHDGDTVLAAEGDYDSGSRVTPSGTLSCRLVLARPVAVRAAGSQAATRIVGVGGARDLGAALSRPSEAPLVAAMRGAYVSDGLLCGFTVTDGGTLPEGIGHEFLDRSGGGLYVTANGVASNCLITACAATHQGGGAMLFEGGRLTHTRLTFDVAPTGGGMCGVDGAVLINSLIDHNTADGSGGGVRLQRSLMANCTLTANTASEAAGGVLGYRAEIANTISYYNVAPAAADWHDPEGESLFSHCCTPVPAPPGSGHVTDIPVFRTGLLGPYRLDKKSHCRDTANHAYLDETTDLDGFARVLGTELDIGACEFAEAALDITNDDFSVDAPVTTAPLGGKAGPTMVTPLAWTNTLLGAAGVLPATSPWLLAAVPLGFGANAIRVHGQSASGDMAEDWVTVTRVMRPDGGPSPEHYVSTTGGDVWPYTNWSGAARTPQRAIDAAWGGDRVRVASGTYAPDAEIVITNAILFVAESGPYGTILSGAGAHRVLRLTGPATVAGFIVTNGSGVAHGAGVHIGAAATVSNCLITGNTASPDAVNISLGGGVVLNADGAMLIECDVVNNQTTGFEPYTAKGGGVVVGNGLVSRCRVRNNASAYAGGICAGPGSLIADCLVTGNYSAYWGGGIGTEIWTVGSGCELRHVTVCGNTSANSGSGIDICANPAWLRNCIVYGNLNVYGYDDDINFYSSSIVVDYSCTPMIWPGTGSIQSSPRLMNPASDDFRLRADSPCIDTGEYLAYPPLPMDVAGLPRVLDGDHDYVPWPDMGAHEYHPMLTDTDGDGMADGWEYWRYLDELDAADGALDFDGDGCVNRGEYDADTNPWNPNSYLRISAFSPGFPCCLTIPESSAARLYTLEQAPAVTGLWTEVAGQSGLPGTDGALGFEDDASGFAGFYRVRAYVPPVP